MHPITSELLQAYLDDALGESDSARVEQALRETPALRDRLRLAMQVRDRGEHSLGAIWSRSRLTCATRQQLGSYLLDALDRQIIDVLHYLHSLPTTIVYRDLKPSNVMIDGNSGRIMLIDFGIARSINQRQEKGVTAVGTMGYAPPELFSGQVEPRSDIYSLGSTMLHLLTGADPQNNPLLIFDFQISLLKYPHTLDKKQCHKL